MCFHDKHPVIAQVLRLYWTYPVPWVTDRHCALCQLSSCHTTCWKYSLTFLHVGLKSYGRKHCWASGYMASIIYKNWLLCSWLTFVHGYLKSTWTDFSKNCHWFQKEDQVLRTRYTHTRKNLPGWKKLYVCKCLIRSCEVIRFILSSSTINRLADSQ